MFKSIKRLTLVLAALGAAIMPTAALARPDGYQPPGYGSPIVQSAAPAPVEHQAAATAAPGFSWNDAGFGAAGMLVLVAIGTGATLAVRRRAILS